MINSNCFPINFFIYFNFSKQNSEYTEVQMIKFFFKKKKINLSCSNPVKFYILLKKRKLRFFSREHTVWDSDIKNMGDTFQISPQLEVHIPNQLVSSKIKWKNLTLNFLGRLVLSSLREYSIWPAHVVLLFSLYPWHTFLAHLVH